MGLLDFLFGKKKSKTVSFSGSNSPKDNDEFYHANNDIVEGMRFSATLQLQVPLKVLEHHGEVFNGLPSEAPKYGDMSQGIWMPNLDDRFTILEKGSTCSSDVGSVEPSKYLPFLIHFRKIVESEKTGDEKLKLFLKMKDLPEFCDFWLKHNERGDYFYMKYVYGTLINIPGVSPQVLFDMGFRNSNELNDKSDNFWLDMKGIGKAKLKKIIEYYAS
ncbi:MAG: hypothetical protein KZQ83_06655 [gamma proteobacterium symbiont of Taylorina sp.]|nr:hypothetical protein [gamma proteobacterium symbiont of Taylorina sp.]